MMSELHQDDEILDVVDLEDRIISQATRSEIHRRSLIHRAVHILVFNYESQLYLQKRVLSKLESPGLWDSSAAGHVESGEDYLTCAHRELNEELKIKGKLTEKDRIRACLETSWEHVVVYFCTTKWKPIPDPLEILEGRYYNLFDIKKLIKAEPKRFTPTFKKIFKKNFK